MNTSKTKTIWTNINMWNLYRAGQNMVKKAIKSHYKQIDHNAQCLSSYNTSQPNVTTTISIETEKNM